MRGLGRFISGRRSPSRRPWALLGLLVLGMVAPPAALADTPIVVDAAGTPLQVIVDLPPGDGRFPALVLAPGQGYHMRLPAMAATARALSARGFAVFRFDWAYFSAVPKGQPSADLARELRDLQAVLAAARAHPQVQAGDVFVGGKSLGSVVAWRALAADRQLRGAVLLTPVCSRVQPGGARPMSLAQENYPGLAAEQRPTLWVSGDRDPLCSPPLLYGHTQGSDRARVGIVGGDHAFERRDLPTEAAATLLDHHLAAVGALAVSFMADHAGGPR